MLYWRESCHCLVCSSDLYKCEGLILCAIIHPGLYINCVGINPIKGLITLFH